MIDWLTEEPGAFVKIMKIGASILMTYLIIFGAVVTFSFSVCLCTWGCRIFRRGLYRLKRFLDLPDSSK